MIKENKDQERKKPHQAVITHHSYMNLSTKSIDSGWTTQPEVVQMILVCLNSASSGNRKKQSKLSLQEVTSIFDLDEP